MLVDAAGPQTATAEVCISLGLLRWTVGTPALLIVTHCRVSKFVV